MEGRVQVMSVRMSVSVVVGLGFRVRGRSCCTEAKFGMTKTDLTATGIDHQCKR